MGLLSRLWKELMILNDNLRECPQVIFCFFYRLFDL